MNGNDRAVSRAQSCAEPVASEDQSQGVWTPLLAKFLILVVLCALGPVVAHLLYLLSVWSWELVG